MSQRRQQPRLSQWQKAARAELRALSAEHPADLTVHLPGMIIEETLVIEITLNTGDLPEPVPGGLQLNGTEDFVIAIPQHALRPPTVSVQHDRFLGFPHVLAGTGLCLYLDYAREWQPAHGIRGLINRLWDWLDDAVNARFDPATALYHAVGGVSHATTGTPTIVVRHAVDTSTRTTTGHLRRRTDHRYDHLPGPPTDPDETSMPVFVAPHNLPLGAGKDRLIDLLERLDYADRQQISIAFTVQPQRRVLLARPTLAAAATSRHDGCKKLPCRHVGIQPSAPPARPAPPSTATALLTVLAASAARQSDGGEQYLLLGVPHPAGGPPHLLGLRLPGTVGDALRRVVRTRTTPILNLQNTNVLPDIAMQWCHLSDERDEVTMRRDTDRPVSALEGKTVHIWGCGGLGSWIAEFATRAGAKKILLCDPSTVTGGLLVRQNYVEANIGDAKAESLAQRLRAISDEVVVEVTTGMLPQDWNEAGASADLIVDATISHAVAQCVERLVENPDRRATIAQVATDARTGTLGLAIVAAPDDTTSIHNVDHAAGDVVTGAADLEAYRIFWTEPGSEDEVTPTRGCSAPTFHGSSADMAGVAGTLLSVIALSMQAGRTGTHLVALPHSGVTPAHRFIPHATLASGVSSA